MRFILLMECWGEDNLPPVSKFLLTPYPRSIGPNSLSVGTLSPHNSSTISTITDNLYQQGKISQDLVSLYFEPTNSKWFANGELTFGGTDSSKYTGDVTYS